MSTFDLFITLGWTVASIFAVLLALISIWRARRVYADALLDLTATTARHKVNGRILFAKQQVSQAKKHLWIYYGILFHQSVFLFIGLFTLFSPSLPEPESLPTVRSVVIPLGLVLGQFVIVACQVVLWRITSEQDAFRREWQEKRS